MIGGYKSLLDLFDGGGAGAQGDRFGEIAGNPFADFADSIGILPWGAKARIAEREAAAGQGQKPNPFAGLANYKPAELRHGTQLLQPQGSQPSRMSDQELIEMLQRATQGQPQPPMQDVGQLNQPAPMHPIVGRRIATPTYQQPSPISGMQPIGSPQDNMAAASEAELMEMIRRARR